MLAPSRSVLNKECSEGLSFDRSYVLQFLPPLLGCRCSSSARFCICLFMAFPIHVVTIAPQTARGCLQLALKWPNFGPFSTAYCQYELCRTLP
jgi:hypothetical protein